MSIKMFCTPEEADELFNSFHGDKQVELFNRSFFVQGMKATPSRWQTDIYEVDVDLIEVQKLNKSKTPEQILATERYTHYKAKMEAAKKDMEYWEERL